jgi:chemotaxis protein histidine kinase CheA/CheY-like chemotaxis protein
MKSVSKYLNIFVDEGRDVVARLGQRLLLIEETPGDTAAMESSLRLAHTLKGSSKMVGLDNISSAAHQVETSLKQIEADPSSDSARITPLLKALDRIKEVLDQIASGKVEEALAIRIELGKEEPSAGKKAPKAAKTSLEAEPIQPLKMDPADTFRVRSGRVDKLQNLVEDMTVQKWKVLSGLEGIRGYTSNASGAQAHINNSLTQVTDAAPPNLNEFTEDVHRIGAMVNELQLLMMELRMIPCSRLLSEYRRVIRDLALELDKDVAVNIEGEQTEVDRSLLENIQAPLTHLVRNAVGHGIETPEERRAAGKPERATISIKAYQKTGVVVVEVEDDGRGIDADVIRKTAVDRGFMGPEDVDDLSDREALQLLCKSGFTTRTEADELSGRGVGLDVVKVRMERLGGTLSIKSELGKFTRFRLYLPQSVSIVHGLVARAGEVTAAFPSLFVKHCIGVKPQQFIDDGGVVEFEGESLSPISLRALFGRDPEVAQEPFHVLVLGFRKRLMAVAVDRIEREQELVVKSLGDHLQQVSCVMGVSILGDGEPSPIMDIPELYRRWAGLEASCMKPLPEPVESLSVLVVDDAVTSRHVESTILEDMGHTVLQATDGLEALELIKNNIFDLVVTDLEMPRLDGIELVREIRRSEVFQEMPIIMVSSLTSDEAVDRGYEAGINAYITKDRLSGPVLRRTLKNLFA